MQVYNSWLSLKDKHSRFVIGLGNFDGVHLGHQKLLEELVTLARSIDGTPAVFTFHPHPLAVLNPGNCPPQLLSQESKQSLIAKMGVDVLLLIPFDLTLARMAPGDFIKKVLCDELESKGIVVGYNYTFGHCGRGTPDLLEKLSVKHDYRVRVIPPVMVEGKAVSSTLIRKLIINGEVAEAAKFLGYYPFTEGEVVAGDRRGSTTLGFPTANIEIDEKYLIPANGVYSAKVNVNGDIYYGVANIGIKPTFKCKSKNIEVHLLDFYQNLYGKQIKINYTRRLRGEKRFASPSDLVQQIHRDIHEARKEWSEAKE